MWVQRLSCLSSHLMPPKVCINRKPRPEAEPGLKPRHSDLGVAFLSVILMADPNAHNPSLLPVYCLFDPMLGLTPQEGGALVVVSLFP